MSDDLNSYLTMLNRMTNMLTSNEDARWQKAIELTKAGNSKQAAILVSGVITSPENKHVKKTLANRELGQFLNDPHSELPEGVTFASSEKFNYIAFTAIIKLILMSAERDGVAGKEVITMVKHAVDAGFYELAYSLANMLFDEAKSPQDYVNVEHYFLLAIDYPESDSAKAAALVNYCSIIRDGLITGVKDYKKAIEIYESAARLGQITGMFNAAQVSDWLATEGETEYYEKSLYWLNTLFDRLSSKEPILASDDPEMILDVVPRAHIMIGKMHAYSMIKDADPQKAIDNLRALNSNHQSEFTRRCLDMAYATKISRMDGPAEQGLVNNWAYLLSAMDWEIKEPTLINEEIGSFDIESKYGKCRAMHAWVTKGLLFNGEAGEITDYCKRVVDVIYGNERVSEFLLFSGIGMFLVSEENVYTPALYIKDGKVRFLSIYPGMTYEELVSNIDKQVPFVDQKSFSKSCVLSIAINRMKCGLKLNDNFEFLAEFGYIGRWGVPLARELSQNGNG